MKWHSQSYLGYRIPGSISFAVTLRAPPFTAAIAHAPLPLPTSNTRRPNISCGLSSIYLQPGTGLTLPGSNYHLLKWQRQYRTNKLGKVEQWWCSLLCNCYSRHFLRILVTQLSMWGTVCTWGRKGNSQESRNASKSSCRMVTKTSCCTWKLKWVCRFS